MKIDLSKEFKEYRNNHGNIEIFNFHRFNHFLENCDKYQNFIWDKADEHIEIKITDKTNLSTIIKRNISGDDITYIEEK